MNMYLGVELIYCLSIRLFLSDRELYFSLLGWSGKLRRAIFDKKKVFKCTPLSIQRKICITIFFDLHTPPEYCFTGDDVKVSRGNLATVSFFLVQGLTIAVFQAFKNPLSGLVKPM